jgi:hypothetical protein
VTRAPRLLVLGVTVVTASAFTFTLADPRLSARLDARTSVAVAAIVDSAQRDGLQTEPLVDLALEGSAARARGEMIVQAVRGFATDMRRAREALGPNSSPEEVTAAAQALRHGVDIRQLERLRAAKGGHRYASALNAATYIASKGVPADTVASLVVSLVLANATEAQIASLQADVDRDIAGGTAALVAVSARAYGLERTLATANADGGAPGTALPSARGNTRSTGPAANGQLQGNAAGNATSGGAPAAPRGKPIKRP